MIGWTKQWFQGRREPAASDSIQGLSHRQYAEGLRAVAEWVETHPEFPVPLDRPDAVELVSTWWPDATREDLRRLLDALGPERQYAANGQFTYAARRFGCVELQFMLPIRAACDEEIVEVPRRPLKKRRWRLAVGAFTRADSYKRIAELDWLRDSQGAVIREPGDE